MLHSHFLWYYLTPELGTFIYYKDIENGETLTYRPKCIKGEFSLPWMDQCIPWLTCKDIDSNQFEIRDVIGSGAVKVVCFTLSIIYCLLVSIFRLI